MALMTRPDATPLLQTIHGRERLHGLAERPDPDHAARLMSAFSPHRSLATMHLWTSLKEPGLKEAS